MLIRCTAAALFHLISQPSFVIPIWSGTGVCSFQTGFIADYWKMNVDPLMNLCPVHRGAYVRIDLLLVNRSNGNWTADYIKRIVCTLWRVLLLAKVNWIHFRNSPGKRWLFEFQSSKVLAAAFWHRQVCLYKNERFAERINCTAYSNVLDVWYLKPN